MSLPVLDLAPLSAGPAGEAQVAAALGAACREIGFFCVTNHGVPQRLLDAVFAASARFFALPVETKRAVAIERSRHNRGYVPMEGESSWRPTIRTCWPESRSTGRTSGRTCPGSGPR
jgi:isopenicillin N synthase-like dioxygenase